MVSAGRCVPLPKGDWSNTTTYYMLDIVTHNNIAWICKRECLGQEPTDGTYWQRFGSAAPIATTSVAGIVIPDGVTISVDATGNIEVNIDGSSIYIDSNDGLMKAKLSTLVDVDVTNLADGYVLAWDATEQTWVAVEKGGGGILPHLIIISEPGESVVKAVKGQTEIIATETSTGHYECDVPEFGTWTIHAVLNGDDATVNLVVDTVKIYTVDDSHFHADITVTYPTGATVSCSKSGETTMYATGSPYTFTVHSSGTWTITGVLNGVTVTKNVVISTSGQTESVSFSHTISVDLYSAAADTVSFTDETGSKTATTDTSGKAEAVSISFTDFAPDITFTSSVAKDPDNLSNDYSKTITLTGATTEVDVMPEARSKMLYWYGYNGGVEQGTSANGWNHLSQFTLVGCTFNTNNVGVNSTSNTNLSICGATNSAAASKVHCIAQGSNTTNNAVLNYLSSKDLTTSQQDYVSLSDTLSKKTVDASTVSNGYCEVQAVRSATVTLYALWYE